MRPFLLLCIQILLFTGFALGQDADFRGVHWGASLDEVKEKEQSPLLIEGARKEGVYIALFDEALFGKDVYAYYVFAEDQLVRGGYLFRELPEEGYLLDLLHEQIKVDLADTYGSPDDKIARYTNDQYRGNVSRAMEMGEYTAFYTWDQPETEIIYSARCETSDTDFSIEYISKRLESLEVQTKENTSQEDSR